MKITAPVSITVCPLQPGDPALTVVSQIDPEVYTITEGTLARGGLGWKVCLDAQICGILVLMQKETGISEITVLYVLPAYRGLGMGYVLLEQAAERAMEIWLPLCREAAQRMVSRFGFVYSGESLAGEEEPLVQYVYTPGAVPEARLDVPYIDQREKYPTGCESVSTVMALQYAGLDMSVEAWIDSHLPKGKTPGTENGVYTGANPWKAFPGDPYTTDGWGCFVPVIEKAAETALQNTGLRIRPLYGLSVDTLCRMFVARGIPVIFWATLDMAEGRPCKKSWEMDDGSGTYTWTEPMHCLLMTGYDEENVYFNDPMRGKDTAYPRDAVRRAYRTMHSQVAVVLPERVPMQYAHSAGAVLYTRRAGEIRYLLVKERLGHTGFPKGHLEGNETVFEAAAREILEETGLSAELQTDFRKETLYLLREGSKWKWVTYFAARYEADDIPVHTGEVADFMELPYTEAMEALTYQNTKDLLAMADKWIRLQD
ncbi:MAG: GNAT family N-acetyltransferase [Clostridia bacterium]|nr:GNAT family N-acetyltransferase [Clostridia bacterium]